MALLETAHGSCLTAGDPRGWGPSRLCSGAVSCTSGPCPDPASTGYIEGTTLPACLLPASSSPAVTTTSVPRQCQASWETVIFCKHRLSRATWCCSRLWQPWAQGQSAWDGFSGPHILPTWHQVTQGAEQGSVSMSLLAVAQCHRMPGCPAPQACAGCVTCLLSPCDGS